MVSSRLTKTQKAEILDSYRTGVSANSLAEKYSCTTNTINRTVKTLLSESEYKLLKEKRSKVSNKKEKIFENNNIKGKKEDIEQLNSLISFKAKIDDEVLGEEYENSEFKEIPPLSINDGDGFDEESCSEKKNNKSQGDDISNRNIDNNLELIEPLIADFELDKQKTDFEILPYQSLPESVYMIVDKKVEIELQLISELPEWSFLPENELKRHAILLFSNQRNAKRNCSRNQRVIKIPNTSVFKISQPYLVAKGITRLILEDSIISLEN